MFTKRRSVFVLVWMSGLLIGALFGPRMHVWFWSAILERHPSLVTKNRACMRLAESEMGKDSLYNHLTSPNKAVRTLSAYTLASVEQPWIAASLFGRVPEAHVDERMDILAGLHDYARQNRWVLARLRLELKNNRNSPRVRSEVSTLLRSISEAGSFTPGTRVWK